MPVTDFVNEITQLKEPRNPLLKEVIRDGRITAALHRLQALQ